MLSHIYVVAMRIKYGKFKNMLQEVMQEAEGECNIRFVEGETLTLHRAVRVIPKGEGYFGGEPTGTRGRGTTAATLKAGTKCKVLKRIGSQNAWCQVEGLNKPVKIHINKFCPEKSEQYLGSTARGGAGMEVPKILTPQEELDAALKAEEAAKEAYLHAKAEVIRIRKTLEQA